MTYTDYFDWGDCPARVYFFCDGKRPPSSAKSGTPLTASLLWTKKTCGS